MKHHLFKGVLVFLVILIQAGNAMTAWSHAGLVSADPAPGASVSRSPEEIRLTFSESLQPGSTFVLFATDFKEIGGINPQIDAQHAEQIFSTIPNLSPDTYTVQWTAITEDSGETNGSFAFSVKERNAFEPWLVAVIIGGAIIILLAFWFIRRPRIGN